MAGSLPIPIHVLLECPVQFTATFEATPCPRHFERGDRGHFEFQARDKSIPPVIVKADRELTTDHVENFLQCVQTRKLPNADVLIGHRSAQASHLGNISYVQKRRLDFDPVREEIQPF